MPMTLQNIFNLLWTKPYECFFGVLIFLVVAPFMTTIGALVVIDPAISPLWDLMAIYLCTLAVLAVMLNMGDQKTSAKDLFWAWIFFSGGATLLAIFGYLEILFFRWLSG
jgi:hypothetical protein